MTHLSLFSGIGGLDLAAEWAGFRTVAFCEREPFCQKVLAKNFPGTPIFDDVTTLTSESLRSRDVDPGKITLVSGGFPCQPHSLAGKRLASDDERDLWAECVRIIRETKPRWFVGENVLGLLSSESGRFFGRVLRDLAALGMDAGWATYGSGDVGASHYRPRVFLVAHAHQADDTQPLEVGGIHRRWYDPEGFWRENRNLLSMATSCMAPETWWPTWSDAPRPLLVRDDDGVPHRLDRLGALGNAVNPYQAYPILAAIAKELSK